MTRNLRSTILRIVSTSPYLFSLPRRSRTPTTKTSRVTLCGSSSNAATPRSHPSVVLLGLNLISAAMTSSAPSTQSRQQSTPTTMTLVLSPKVGTPDPSSLAPSASSLPSLLVARDRPTLLTSPLARPWSGFGITSSSPSSPALSFTSTPPATRFVSSFFLSLHTVGRLTSSEGRVVLGYIYVLRHFYY